MSQRVPESVKEFRNSIVEEGAATVAVFNRALAAVGFPDDMREGETYRVDLEKPWFEVTSKGAPVLFGPCQLIGTYLEEAGSWMWGFSNPSIAASGYSEIQKFIEKEPLLAKLRQSPKLEEKERHHVEALAGWIAHRAGYIAFPAPVGDAIAMLALKVTPYPNYSFEPSDNVWCSFCGMYPEKDGPPMVAAPGSFICRECVDLLAEIYEPNSTHPKSQPVDAETAFALAICLFCETRKASMVHLNDLGGLCRDCIGSLIEMFEEQRKDQ